MKKTPKTDDRTNFTIGVTSGFGALKNRIGFTILGLVIGSACGFKWANYNYRQVQGADNNAKIAQVTEKIKANPNGAGEGASEPQQMPAQITETIKKAKDNPNDFEAQRHAAELYMQIRRPEGALTFLQQANKLKPADGEVMGEMAGAYFFQENYQEAIPWARKALTKDQKNRTAKFYLASSLILSQQSLDEAEKLLNQVEVDSKSAPGEAQQVLTQMRERLQQAKSGQASPSGKTGDAKTMLQHGADPGGPK